MSAMWMQWANLAFESQQVIWMRLLKLSAGGPQANIEAQRMVDEKIEAAFGAGRQLAAGESLNSVVNGYRRKVRANARRLTR